MPAGQHVLTVRLRSADARAVERLARSIGISSTACCQRLLVAALERAAAGQERAERRRWRLVQEVRRVRAALAAWRAEAGATPGAQAPREDPQSAAEDDLMQFSLDHADLDRAGQARLLGVPRTTYVHVLNHLATRYAPDPFGG
ncbi:MAG: hypothetical protein D6798_09615 [Deltaproteobacteria bacterium]|nr:MAG: hypothetical protein D6798_09615 [Deltaproteobacteria bacterium]